MIPRNPSRFRRFSIPPDAIAIDYCGPGDVGWTVHISPVETTYEATVVGG